MQQHLKTGPESIGTMVPRQLWYAERVASMGRKRRKLYFLGKSQWGYTKCARKRGQNLKTLVEAVVSGGGSRELQHSTGHAVDDDGRKRTCVRRSRIESLRAEV